MVSLLEGEIACNDIPAPGAIEKHRVTPSTREVFSERVEQSHLTEPAKAPMYREPTLREKQDQLFQQMNEKNLQSAPPPVTLQQGNTTLSVQAVSGNTTGTG